MKHFILSVFLFACSFILLVVLSVRGNSLYLGSMQNQAGHFMQFANEYILESKREGGSVISDDSAKRISTMAGCRICFFSSDGNLLADSDSTGQKPPELYFPVSNISIAGKTVSSSIANINGQYELNEFSTVQLSNTDYVVICVSLPLNGYDKLLLLQKSIIAAGLVIFVVSVICSVIQKKALQKKESAEPTVDLKLKDRIDQINFYSNERISLLSTVLSNMDSGIIFFSPSCSILLMNPKAQQLTGAKSSLFFPKDEMAQDDFPPVLADVRAMVQKSMSTKESEKKDLQTADGKILSIRTTVVYSKYIPFTFYGVQAFITDVTEKRRMERIRDEFVSNVSHELRTPLTLICGFSETLQSWKKLDSEDCQHALEIIGIESNRLKHMISQLLDLSHIESRIDTGTLRPINPIEPVRTIGSSLEVLAKAHNITFTINLPEESAEILGDKTSVVQIVSNLCENAIKYTSAGGAVALSAGIDKDSLFFKVRDNGIGIAESEIPHIFERFYRVEKSRNTKRGGSGLGLSITKALVDELGGSITVKSKLHKGSVFSVCFPLLQQGKVSAEKETKTTVKPT